MAPFFRRFFQFGPGMPEPTPGPQRGTGSGVVMDARGNIVTNRHVVSGATRFKVTFSDGREFTRQDARHGRGDGRRGDPAGQAARRSGGGAAGRLGQARRRRVGAGGRQPARPRSDGDRRDRQRPGQGRAARADVGRPRAPLHPDRRQDQSGQLGRAAGATCRPRWSGSTRSSTPGRAAPTASRFRSIRCGWWRRRCSRRGACATRTWACWSATSKALDPSGEGARWRGDRAAARFVSQVTPGGPAAKAGLQAGDVITEIDGQQDGGGGRRHRLRLDARDRLARDVGLVRGGQAAEGRGRAGRAAVAPTRARGRRRRSWAWRCRR